MLTGQGSGAAAGGYSGGQYMSAACYVRESTFEGTDYLESQHLDTISTSYAIEIASITDAATYSHSAYYTADY
jgi:hypothetical protein